MLTQDDLNRLKKDLATKDDLQQLASKEDLKPLETNLRRLETNLEQLETRVDTHLEQLELRMNIRMDRLQEGIYGVLKFADTIEEERMKNEKRLKAVEIKLDLQTP